MRELARQVGRTASTVSRELRRDAATRGGQLAYRASVAQWHAERRARRPKIAKLASHDRLRGYVQDRLAGTVTDPDGRPIPGPNVAWKGRRHGRRADRRWAPRGVLSKSVTGSRSTSPKKDDANPAGGHLPGALRPGPRWAAPRADRLPARGQGVAGAPSTDPRARQEVRQRPAEVDDRAVSSTGNLNGVVKRLEPSLVARRSRCGCRVAVPTGRRCVVGPAR